MREEFTPYYALEAEGHRIGVMSCKQCGAAVILDTEDEAGKRHVLWHKRGEDRLARITRTAKRRKP